MQTRRLVLGHARLSTLALLSGMAIVAVGCGPLPEEGADLGADESAEANGSALRAERVPAYGDVEETWSNEDDQSRWFELKHGLAQDFDDICGDTFCEGDFSNLQSMRFRCSVSARTGQIKTCLWLFAGSYETVTASTGNVRPVAKFFSCTFPVAGTPRDLMNALLTTEGRGPLWRPLPGTTTSIYDRLGACL